MKKSATKKYIEWKDARNKMWALIVIDILVFISAILMAFFGFNLFNDSPAAGLWYSPVSIAQLTYVEVTSFIIAIIYIIVIMSLIFMVFEAYDEAEELYRRL